MNLRPILLVLLIVAASVVAAFEYAQNAQLSAENQRLKKELSDSTQRLLALQIQLNKTQGEVARLQMDVAKLEEDIAKLREQLKRESYIAVGLTFIWSINYDLLLPRISVEDLRQGVELLNEQWDKFSVYFFIDHLAGSQSFVPGSQNCREYPVYIGYSVVGMYPAFGTPWAEQAWRLYPERDIPVAIVTSLTDWQALAGCAASDRSSRQWIIGVASGDYNGTDWVNLSPRPLSAILTHELLHVLGFTEKELGLYVILDWDIPLDWRARIQEAAKAFEIEPPPLI